MAEETLVRGFAVLAGDPEDDDAEGPWTVHGVAIGVDDVTVGQSGLKKVWPADALRAAADTLSGTPIVKNHINQDVDAVVGAVTRSWFEEGVGVLYEGELDDRDLALKVQRDRLDVSPRIFHGDPADMEENEEGAIIMDTVHEFINLSLVPRGAAPSNSIMEGPAPTMSAAELAEFFEDPEDDPEDPADDADDLSVDDVEDVVSTENGQVVDNDNLSDDPPGNDPEDDPEDPATTAPDEWADSLLVRVSADNHLSTLMDDKEKLLVHLEKQAEDLGCEPEDLAFVPKGTQEELNSTIDDLQAEVEELTTTKEDLEEEVTAVKKAYAEALADDSLFTVEDLMDRFDVAELREKYEAAVEAEEVEELGTTPEPDPKSGDVEELETPDPDDDLSDEEKARVEELKANIEALTGKPGTLAETQREVYEEELADLTGEAE